MVTVPELVAIAGVGLFVGLYISVLFCINLLFLYSILNTIETGVFDELDFGVYIGAFVFDCVTILILVIFL